MTGELSLRMRSVILSDPVDFLVLIFDRSLIINDEYCYSHLQMQIVKKFTSCEMLQLTLKLKILP